MEGFVLDLDGTVYRGDEPIGTAFAALCRMRSAGIPVAFATNNSTRSRVDVAAKLGRMGFEVSADRVVTSASATADYLRREAAGAERIHVIGSHNLVSEIEGAGFEVTRGASDFVVVGLDRDVTYDRIRAAVRALLAGARLIITNPDRLVPEGDSLDPGAGAIAASLQYAVPGAAAPVIIGKPSGLLPTLAVQALGTRAAHTVFIGDQLSTDIAAGQAAGMFSVLVRTGVPVAADGSVTPDRVLADMSELPRFGRWG